MIEKLKQLFNRKVVFIIALVYVAMYLAYNVTIAFEVGYLGLLYYVSDLAVLFVIGLYGYYTIKDETRKASKLFYLIAGYVVATAAVYGVASLTYVKDDFASKETFSALNELFYGIDEMLICAGLCTFVTYKIASKKRPVFVKIASYFMLASILFGLASVATCICAYFDKNASWEVREIFDSVLLAILPLLLCGCCVLSTNRTEDFDIDEDNKPTNVTRKVASILNRTIMLVLAGILALLLVSYDLMYAIEVLKVGFETPFEVVIYYLGDIISILFLVGLGFYTVKGQHSKANKLFYLYMGYIVFDAVLDFTIDFKLLTELKEFNSLWQEELLTTNMIRFITFSVISNFTLVVSVGLFIAYKLITKKEKFNVLVIIAICFALLSTVAMIIADVFSIISTSNMFEPTTFDMVTTIISAVSNAIVPVLVLSQCCVTMDYQGKGE